VPLEEIEDAQDPFVEPRQSQGGFAQPDAVEAAEVVEQFEETQPTSNTYPEEAKASSLAVSAPQPQANTDEVAEEDAAEPGQAEHDAEEEVTITPKDLEQLKEVELFIGEKLYLMGKAASEIFTRFDTVGTGCVTEDEFRAAMALIGLALYPQELRIFKKKFASASHPGLIDYNIFMRYVDALRMRRPRDLTTLTIAQRPPITPEATRDILAKVKTPLLTRLQRGFKLVREHLYIHSKAIGQLYKALKNDRGVVEIATLVKNLTNYGFPKDLVADSELSAYLRETAGVDGDLNYNQFARLMQGHPEVIAEDPTAPRNLLADPAFVSVLVKLNSMQLRTHFKQLDTDQDDLITVQEVINDLANLGLSPEICKLPELEELIRRFSNRFPGYLLYGEYLQLVNARVGNLPSAVQVPIHVEIPEDATLHDLIVTLHNSTKHGVSLDSVFAQFAPLKSRAITETDLWHALTSIGFIVPRELNAKFFNAFARREDTEEPTIDYKDVSLTILQPTRNPRFASVPIGSDNIPLGSTVSNYHEFIEADTAAAMASAARKIGRVPGMDTHRQGSQIFGSEPASPQKSSRSQNDEGQPQQQQSQQQTTISRRMGLTTRSSVKFGDLTQEELEASAKARGARQTEASARLNAHTKGHIDFAGDHGAQPQVSRVSTSRAAQSSVNLSTEMTAEERAKQIADLAARSANDHKTASDIFGLKSPQNQQASVKPAGPISNVCFDYTDATHAQSPEAAAAAAADYANRPRTAMSMVFDHNEENPAPPASSVTGYARRGNAHAPKATIDLTFDPASPAPPTRPKTGRRTYEDAIGARDNFDEISTDLTLQELRDQQAEMQHEAQRRARAPGASRPAQAGPPFAGQNIEENDQLIADLDARILTPQKSRASSNPVEQVSAQSEQLDMAYLERLGREVYTKGKVRSVFTEWAQGGTSLTKEQLAAGAAKIHYPLSASQLDLIFAAYDREGKGTLSYADFMRMLSART